MNRLLTLGTFAILFALGFQIKKGLEPKVAFDDVEEEPVKKIRKKKAPVQAPPPQRSIASVPTQPLPPTETYREIQRDDNPFEDLFDKKGPESAPEASPEVVSSGGAYFGGNSSNTPASENSQRPTRSRSSGQNNAQTTTTSSQNPSTLGASPNSAPDNIMDPNGSMNNGESTGGGKGGGGANTADSTPPSCFADVGTGTYSSPFSVTLSCSTASDIKYCLSENTCCDPSTGTTYTGPFLVNPGAGNYCLSFTGTSQTNGVTSKIVDNTYTFNPDSPDLQVAHQKVQYQSTELSGIVTATSADYGDPNISMGVINLKNHNPGATGLNWSCDQIFSNFTSLTGAVPHETMPDTSVSGFSPSSQIDVFLAGPTLAYGNNFITTYMKNNEFLEPIFSCSTRNVVLEDFPYFEATPHQAVAGTNDVREFAGGFTHLGFFEPEQTVYRGPAGSSSTEVASQELETGLFGIFY